MQRLNPVDIRSRMDDTHAKFGFGRTWAGVNLHYYIKDQAEAGNKKPKRFQKVYQDFMGSIKVITGSPDGEDRIKILLLQSLIDSYNERIRSLKFDPIMEEYALCVIRTAYREAMRKVDPKLDRRSERNVNRSQVV
jgi:hypothetical protein